LFTDALEFSATDFIQTPDCGYTLEYQVRRYDPITITYTSLPPMISYGQVPAGFDFSVYSTNAAQADSYVISVLATVPSLFMPDTFSSEH
jgi:hypothetical protein